jgi:hypothetical protein
MTVLEWCLTWLSPDWCASKKEQARLDRECERQELCDEIEDLKAEIEALKDG